MKRFVLYFFSSIVCTKNTTFEQLVKKIMIFTKKIEIARYLGCGRGKIYDMIKRNEVKELYIGKDKVGYVIVLEFIKYLLI